MFLKYTLGLVLAFQVSCASRPLLPHTAARHADAQTRNLRFLVRRTYESSGTSAALPEATLAHSGARRLADAMESWLRAGGYQTTEQILAGGDVEITIDILAAPVSESSEDEMSLLVSTWVDGRSIDSISLPFDPRDEVPQASIHAAVILATDEATTQPAVEYHQRRLETTRRRVSDELDDRAWSSADLQACLAPRTSDSCESVRQYLRSLPGGRHAQQARAALSQAQPVIQELTKETRYWARTELECQSGSEACGRLLRGYIRFWPGGERTNEAKDRLRLLS